MGGKLDNRVKKLERTKPRPEFVLGSVTTLEAQNAFDRIVNSEDGLERLQARGIPAQRPRD